MKRLFFYLKKHAISYCLAMILLVAAVILDMFYPRITKIIIDDVIIGGKSNLMKYVLPAFACICIARASMGYLKELMFDFASMKTAAAIRMDLFKHIQSLSFSFFDKTNTGELMSRIKEDVENIWHVLCFGFMLFFENVIYFITASIILFVLNWKLAAISTVTMPVIAFIALRFEKKLRNTYGKLSDQRAIINTTAQENLAGVRLVKAFGRERYEIKKFLEQNRENCKLSMEQAYIISNYNPKIEFLSNMIVVLITTIGGILVIGDEISIGTLVAFSSYISMLIWPMRMIGWLINLFAECKASLEKIEKIFNEEPVIKNADNPIIPQEFKGHVIFKDVCFEYNGVPVLKNINFEAKPGTAIAIIGMTGAGKSSIVNLIPRYYDCTSGCVLIDGTDVRNHDLKELRKHISVVMQDVFLFSDTVRENIKFGLDDINEDDLIQASKDADVNDFAVCMPQGYESIIGERGIGLSGGQKQRISIARALARESSILILDDATSALDMETEFQVRKSLEKRKGLTKFIIAHRISAVKNADEILMINNGEIVERGTHDELLRLGGMYYEIYCEQYKGLNVSDGENSRDGNIYKKEVV